MARVMTPFRFTFLALVAVGVLLLTPVSASAAGTLDQSQTTQTPAGAAGWVTTSTWNAQTFTAGSSGRLDQIDLLLQRSGFPGTLSVEIRTTLDGTPTNTVLATATVPEAGVSCCSFDWISVPLATPAPSTIGTQYAIVLSAPTAGGCDSSGNCDGFYWGAALTNPYPGGTQVFSNDGGANWFPVFLTPDLDFAFKTYVSPPLPTSVSQCLMGGWTSFQQFRNAGDCVSFVATGGRNTGS